MRPCEPQPYPQSSPTPKPGAHNPDLLSCHGFGANFEYLLNSTNQSAKPTDMKMTFSTPFSFPFQGVLYFECAHRHGGDSILTQVLKWSLKTPAPGPWKLKKDRL